MKKQIWLATLAFVVFLVFIGIIYAFTWHMRITWTVQVSTDFSVYTDVACTDPWISPLDLTDVLLDQTFDFYIKNDVTIAIYVTIINEVIIEGSASWNPSSLTLNPGESDKMTLTLSFTDDGSYDFDFNSVET